MLLHIARTIYPDIRAIYSDTGLEYPELKAMVKETENVLIVRPDKDFKTVLRERGYPLVSKEVSEAIYYARRIGKSAERERRRSDFNNVAYTATEANRTLR